jgi:uncharacterized protein YciI
VRSFILSIVILSLLSLSNINAQDKPFVLGEYTMVILKSNEQAAQSSDARIQTEHQAFVHNLAASGKALLVGHISGSDTLRGIVIFDEKSKEKVKQIIDEDPAVKSGRFKADIFTWATDKNAFSAKQAETPVIASTYYFGILRRGPKWTAESTPAIQQLQQAHMDNIGKMARSGKLVLAGPFGGAGDMAGIFVFKVDSLEDAKTLAATDPTVIAGRLVIEMYAMNVPKGMLP